MNEDLLPHVHKPAYKQGNLLLMLITLSMFNAAVPFGGATVKSSGFSVSLNGLMSCTTGEWSGNVWRSTYGMTSPPRS